ncbi:uncharacterized protein LOC126898690 isoform X2 [Daktulosphaira vitifoliae]|uniref:uncharacterized protein LOC126898690 isoform X2 n=1 Tax=Daktulosphaira vitifoliae TaxID=58002 RepID=UPI0021AA3A1D|nr:uncharacterized protein LOC126898690 isoform X2 [Daktulosphaira vitifoliae]
MQLTSYFEIALENGDNAGDNQPSNTESEIVGIGPSCNSVNKDVIVKNILCHEVYIPKRQGSFMSNSFVMSFCTPTIMDHLKSLVGINSYKYEDRIQYKLYKSRTSKEPDLLINTIYVEKNALHCQGLK